MNRRLVPLGCWSGWDIIPLRSSLSLLDKFRIHSSEYIGKLQCLWSRSVELRSSFLRPVVHPNRVIESGNCHKAYFGRYVRSTLWTFSVFNSTLSTLISPLKPQWTVNSFKHGWRSLSPILTSYRRLEDTTSKGMPGKHSRFYFSPINEKTNLNPVQLYGLEMREPSIIEKPTLLLRVVDALRHAMEDDARLFNDNTGGNGTTQYHSLLFHDCNFTVSASEQKDAMLLRSSLRSQPASLNSDAYFSPSLRQRLVRKLIRWPSFWAKSRESPGSNGFTNSPTEVVSSSVLWERLGG